MTLPVDALERAGLNAGDEVTVLRRARRDRTGGLGVFDGLYGAGYLERLRAAERA